MYMYIEQECHVGLLVVVVIHHKGLTRTLSLTLEL
jgi:hypothetical protein